MRHIPELVHVDASSDLARGGPSSPKARIPLCFPVFVVLQLKEIRQMSSPEIDDSMSVSGATLPVKCFGGLDDDCEG